MIFVCLNKKIKNVKDEVGRMKKRSNDKNEVNQKKDEHSLGSMDQYKLLTKG